MIINIPLQIDEQKMEEVVARDYEGKIFEEITKCIKSTLAKKAQNYYGDKVVDGMQFLIEARIEKYLADYKDEIIEHASKLLAEKLAKSKRGKEILEKYERMETVENDSTDKG